MLVKVIYEDNIAMMNMGKKFRETFMLILIVIDSLENIISIFV